ncbi:hypothetical protein PGT21_015981 [Puccinia graminis f. sp. tritici]|uniref:HTH APSES-type domain-containing protein n=2 Tax=Puccinia graminis f. sp. tritici TaxID=56615 RepID=A0A5B0MWV6_PUCGR|nr:hypothetical protein PGT21_015981 [Puccinia graminis f. sp. tritici]
MAAAPTSSFLTSMSAQPPRTVQALVNEEVRAPPPVRLYPSQHRVSMTRYATSTDPRGYIPVFEYPLNGQYIMIDCETGMVHFTGIWKALGHTKADVVKLVESDPTIAPYLRKVRGGYLKIQGTWLPFDTAQTLARRVAWQVRYDLVPLFGPDFPDTCLGPGEPGFGQLLLSAPKPRGRRGAKKAAAAPTVTHERTASPQDNRSQSRPGPYPSQESFGNRCSGRVEAVGAMNGYSPMLSQARYSPYTRAPVHRITQLEPLPSLIQPNQSCPHPTTDSMYSSHYHQSPRQSMMASHGAGPYGQQHLTGSTASGMESTAPLPSMRPYQAHQSENNFFETYRGPDSFEALSNKWLAPEVTNPSLNDSGLLHGEGGCLPPLQYSNNPVLRKGPSGSPTNQYNFPNQIDSAHSSHHIDSNQTQHVHRHAGFPYESQHQSNFRHDLSTEEAAHHPASPSQQPPPSVTYDKAHNSEPQAGSQAANVTAGCYAASGSNSTGNPAGSPGSHSSHVPKSPTPSSASTSTHMQNSHNPNSHRSPSNTLTNMSNNGGFNSNTQGEEAIQFSVLTSPAHLETSGPSENSIPPAQSSDSDWNPAQNTTGLSPSQAPRQ